MISRDCNAALDSAKSRLEKQSMKKKVLFFLKKLFYSAVTYNTTHYYQVCNSSIFISGDGTEVFFFFQVISLPVFFCFVLFLEVS